ncbi:hypothetical protein EVAR_22018_1 [Eumeta japonica]|uniref:Uncharacterized protein n=1 Tax=Eumeta variegata TaxID=151549 RepID=A0A4C1Z0H2_EUMVA|nr:hypothetical protein EVAR_22018_1 [Eumeta japonica]
MACLLLFIPSIARVNKSLAPGTRSSTYIIAPPALRPPLSIKEEMRAKEQEEGKDRKRKFVAHTKRKCPAIGDG